MNLTGTNHNPTSAATYQDYKKTHSDQTQVEVSKISEHSLKHLGDNNQSDLVIKTSNGELYKFSADELQVDNGELPDVNTHVEIAGIEGEVVYKDEVLPRRIELKGHNGFGLINAEEAVQVREINPDASYDDILRAVDGDNPQYGNNIDELVVKTDSGQTYLFFADELDVAEGEMPKVGELVQIGDITGKVIVVDDENNEEMQVAAAAGFAVPFIAAGAFVGVGYGVGLATMAGIKISAAAASGFAYGAASMTAVTVGLEYLTRAPGAHAENDDMLMDISSSTTAAQNVQRQINQN